MVRKMIQDSWERDRVWWQAGGAALLAALIVGSFAYYGHLRQEEVAREEAAQAAAQKPRPDAFANVVLQGKAAIVYDLATGETLYAKNAESQLPLASLTKLLTMFAAADVLGDNTPVAITASALSQEGESGFFEGETFYFNDLARLALVSSSNDASAAIAEAAAARKGMNNKSLMASAAAAAHLTQTYAVNGTGLDESMTQSGGYGSARDVAILAGELLRKAPEIARATTETSVTISSLEGVPHSLDNTNQEVERVPGALLSKTGFTDLAGGNLVVVFDAGLGHPVAAVVLGSTREGRFSDVNYLMTATRAHFAGIQP